MKRSSAVLMAATAGFALCCTALEAAGTASVWDGVYTAGQASRGGAQFASHCASCHGASLTGSEIAPPLAGTTFLRKWSGNTVADLANVISTTMPSDAPGSLDAKTVADITAYMLSVNQMPAGTAELPADPTAQKNIRIDATKPGAAEVASSAPSAGTIMAESPATNEWTSWGYDQERTGWNRAETTLSKTNVSKLKIKWSAQLSTPVTDVVLSTVTAPLVAAGVSTPQGPKNLVLLLGADDTMFALDADTGKVFWQATVHNPMTALRPATWSCSNTANATPVIDKARGLVYFITSDGKLRGLSLADGSEKLAAVDFVDPFARSWSLNLIDNIVYTATGRSCGQVPGQRPPAARGPRAGAGAAAGGRGGAAGAAAGGRGGRGGRGGPAGPVEAGSVSAMDVSDLAHPKVTTYFTSSGRQGGPWDRGGVARTPKGVVTQTADGLYDPAADEFGETILELTPGAARLTDSFTPTNWKFLNLHDLDSASGSPIVFPFAGKTLVTFAGKEGVVYLLDAADLGGGPPTHSTPFYQSPQIANDQSLGGNTLGGPGQGVWGSMATYETADGKRYLYVPVWGPPAKNAAPFPNSNGPIPNGSIMAFQLTANGDKIAMVPQWSSPNMIVPDPPVVANGVVFAMQTGEQTMQIPATPGVREDNLAWAKFRATPANNLILYAFDAETGKQLYSSKKLISNWTHFSEPAVALGKVFVVTHDAHVYAFGL